MLISGKDINAERFVRVFRDKGIQFSTAGGVVRLDGPADITARAQAVLDALNTSPEAADNVLHFLTAEADSMAGHSTAGTADAPLTDSDEHGKAEKDINTFAAENDAQEPSIKGIRVIVSGGSSLVQSAVAAGGHDAGAYVRTLKLLYKGGPDVLEFKDTLGEYERGLIDARFLQPDGEPVAEVLNAAVVFFAERKKI